VRALWESRDALARDRDLAPGRLLPDAAIVQAALADPASPAALFAVPVFGGRQQRRLLSRWYAAIAAARALPDPELPSLAVPSDAPPPVNRWADRDPEAAARLAAARAVMTALAKRHAVPVENLLAPDLLRRLAWEPPAERSAHRLAAILTAAGARPWQVELAARPLAEALQARVGAGAEAATPVAAPSVAPADTGS
jgi:ribonuclease D